MYILQVLCDNNRRIYILLLNLIYKIIKPRPVLYKMHGTKVFDGQYVRPLTSERATLKCHLHAIRATMGGRFEIKSADLSWPTVASTSCLHLIICM